MNRRSFLSMITGAVAAALLPKRTVHKSGWYASKPSAKIIAAREGTYTYTYVYRNSVTGCCSDASVTVPPPHTFAMPEHDVMDMYSISESGEVVWMATIL